MRLAFPALLLGAFMAFAAPALAQTATGPADNPVPRPNLAFDVWLAEFRAAAGPEGISPATLDRALAGLVPDDRVIELDGRQPEFTRTVGDYLESAVSDLRILAGRVMRLRHRTLLGSVAEQYQVRPQYILAIWGIESNYGHNFGDFSVIRSLATLAWNGARTGRREEWARRELIEALRIVEEGALSTDELIGSWAGAMGHTQFMPSSWHSRAVDWDGDGRRDLWDSMGDVFASTANYLAAIGWDWDTPWGLEVRLPDDFEWELADAGIRKPVAEWRALGIRRADGDALEVPDDQTGSIILPMGWRGPAFLILDNFRTILRYNNSTAYALAVAHLADRITGRGAIRADWPSLGPPLSLDDRTALQEKLTTRGYDTGPADGIIGPDTRAAVRGFQRELGWPADGVPTMDLLSALRLRARP